MSSVLGLLLAFFMSVGAYAQDIKLSVDKVYLKPGNTATITVKIDNKVTFGAMKTTINLPEGLSFVASKTYDDGTFDLTYGKTEISKKARFILSLIHI